MLNKKLFISTTIFTILLLLFIFLDKKYDVLLNGGLISPPLATETSMMEAFLIRDMERNEKMLRLKYTSDEFQAGMNILIYGHPDMLETKNVFEHLRSLGINSVALNFPFYQSDWQANEVFANPELTPTNAELLEIINIAHDSGLSVMIRPIMDEQVFLSKGRWRGQIKPKDPASWFDSYQALILNYATLAESTNAKALNIGTELTSMQQNYQDRWIELIENVRDIYKGELLYSFNYDTVSEIPSIEFISLLDHIGIDAYFPLNLPDDASVDMLLEEWKNQINHLEEVMSQESIIVTEVGVLPITGAYRIPYAWSIPNGKYDPEVQVNYYEATYQTWKPQSKGIYWWVVTLGQDSNITSFSPLDLPTEEVIKKYFIKDVQHE
ncbi:glycoside hydrolase family 113 [Oceanobacillus sp. CAU 1775]